MIKRFVSFLLILFLLNSVSLPIFAVEGDIKETRIINTEFKTDLNVNKASKGQVVQFVSTQDYSVDGLTIPEGTIFSGQVTHFKKGRWAYRRAKVVIHIDKMTFPSGETYNINASTKRHVLKGSALVNTGKGIISFPVSIVVGVAGSVVVIVEAVSIVGIIAIGPTCYSFGRVMGTLTHGINYKKHEGDKIKLHLKSIKEIFE